MPESEMTMVERVARAICAADGHDPDGPPIDEYPSAIYPWAVYRNLAKAAIEAMREPSEEMKKAGEHAEISDSYGEYYVSADNAADIFRAMVDAALKEHGGEKA